MRENNDIFQFNEKRHIATNIDKLHQVLTSFKVDDIKLLLTVLFSAHIKYNFNENCRWKFRIESVYLKDNFSENNKYLDYCSMQMNTKMENFFGKPIQRLKLKELIRSSCLQCIY